MKKILDLVSALVRDSKRGKREAFNHLVLKFQDQLFHTVFRMLGDFHEAKDVTQEAFLKAYVAIQDFKEESAFYTWLYRIALNSCISRLRKEGRAGPTASLEAGGEGGGGPPEAAARGEADNPVKNLEAKEQRRLVQEGIRTLDEEDRAVIILRDIEGFAYEEIAEILELPLGTVKSRLARARAALREKLKGIL